MIKVVWQLAFVSLIVFVGSSNAVAFTDSQVRDLLARIDAAAQQQDAQAVGRFLSDEFHITVEVPTPSGMVRMELDKQQYLDAMIHGWNVFGPDYTYARRSLDIASNGTKAQTTSVVLEEAEVNGRTIVSRILEIANFAIEDDQLKVVNAFGFRYVEGEPVPKAQI